ncbi:MAG: NADH-quinone oxidoreductase subunit NuoN [Burkholderiales bacterium]|nr:NADH-quinone oxidoreductase subunit NuoN [Burkholderiales bacterium]
MTYPNLFPVLPEIFMALMTIIILLVDAFSAKKSVITVLTLLTLIGCFVLQIHVSSPSTQLTFNDMFILDSLATGTKLFTYILSFVAVIYVRRYIIDKEINPGEFYAILLFAILGMMVMISADNMIVLYVGLELLSLALYGLIALQRDNVKATESAMKFFILGALASGILLYGISFIYGATGGNLQLELIVRSMLASQEQGISPLLTFGLAFVVAGLVFKLGLVPFHMWIPDVYEGSPLAVTTMIGSLTKIAAVVFMIRFLVGGLVLLSMYWTIMLLVLAMLSLFFGNIIAIAQTNIKRMLGYSTISHMGFVALGFIVVSVDGITSTLFYVITYSITALATFGILTALSKDGFECESIDDLKGLSSSHPVYAFLLMLTMFSMAGIPPLVGFYAKFKILAALVNTGLTWVAVFAVIMSLIGAFYYIRVVKAMYFDEKVKDIQVANICVGTKVLLVLNTLMLLVIGIFPSYLIDYCQKFIG